MKKHQKQSIKRKYQKSKSSIHSHASRSRRLVQTQATIHNCHPFQNNSRHWYLLKKRSKQRLRVLSNGRIRLVSDPCFPQMYHGHHIRHWLQDTKTEHIFKASLREVALFGADKINPFINCPIDMDHYGNVRAIQEHVHGLSFGNIEFMSNNELGGVDDFYEFGCNIHHHILKTPFSNFLSDPMRVCDLCEFNRK